MNTIDKLVTALTPGSIFNRNALVFRSLQSLAKFAGLPEDEVVSLLHGELAALVTCKPSNKGKGILVALTAALLADALEAGPLAVHLVPVGPGAPILEVEQLEVAAPLAEAPVA